MPNDYDGREYATAFVIVPPIAMLAVDDEDLALMESELKAALPGFQFEVTIDHPQRQEHIFFVDPNGDVGDLETVEKLGLVLARFLGNGPPTLQ